MRAVTLTDILVRLGSRSEIEHLVEALIDALDANDGDPDLEPSLGSLGGTTSAPSFDQRRWSEGDGHDHEDGQEDEAAWRGMPCWSR